MKSIRSIVVAVLAVAAVFAGCVLFAGCAKKEKSDFPGYEKIRPAGYGPADPDTGLAVGLRASGEVIDPEDPFIFYVTVKNFSDRPVEVPDYEALKDNFTLHFRGGEHRSGFATVFLGKIESAMRILDPASTMAFALILGGPDADRSFTHPPESGKYEIYLSLKLKAAAGKKVNLTSNSIKAVVASR